MASDSETVALHGKQYLLADPRRAAGTLPETAAARLAEKAGRLAQSSIFEALANIPLTAHILGGAVIGGDVERGGIDVDGRVFGYRRMLVADGASARSVTESGTSTLPPVVATDPRRHRHRPCDGPGGGAGVLHGPPRRGLATRPLGSRRGRDGRRLDRRPAPARPGPRVVGRRRRWPRGGNRVSRGNASRPELHPSSCRAASRR